MRGVKDRKVPPLFLSGRCTTPPSPAVFSDPGAVLILALPVSIGREGEGGQRLSSHAGWHVPYTSPGGSVYRADFDVYADAWHMDRVSLPSRGAYTGAAGRVVPEAMVTWSLPLYRSQGARRDVLEPIIQGIVSPRGGIRLKLRTTTA